MPPRCLHPQAYYEVESEKLLKGWGEPFSQLNFPHLDFFM